jgi:XTP/dITP diphosphohydrolase
MEKILIATTNPGKFKEIVAELADLHFKFINLTDLKLDNIEVEEPHLTTWENAVEKARFFARKTGLITIAEDTGLFIDALDGNPGVKAKRFAPTATLRVQKNIKKNEKSAGEKKERHILKLPAAFTIHTLKISTYLPAKQTG